MKSICTLIAVENMQASKQFYRDVLGLGIAADFGANVTLDGGIALQTVESWREFIAGRDVTLPNHAGELVFEEADMDRFLAHLGQFEIDYVHPPMEHRWGQRVVRFYDPDCHVIEVGEEMVQVVRRFSGRGMTEAQIAERMDVSPDYVRRCLSGT